MIRTLRAVPETAILRWWYYDGTEACARIILEAMGYSENQQPLELLHAVLDMPPKRGWISEYAEWVADETFEECFLEVND